MIELDWFAVMAVAVLCIAGIAILWWRTRELEQQLTRSCQQLELFTEASIRMGRTLNNYLAGTEPAAGQAPLRGLSLDTKVPYAGATASSIGATASHIDATASHKEATASHKGATALQHSTIAESNGQLGRWPVLQLARRKLASGVALSELEPMLNLSRAERDLLGLLDARNQIEQSPVAPAPAAAARRGGALDIFE